MTDRYNFLCQKGLLVPGHFHYSRADNLNWVCRVFEPVQMRRQATRKRDAKNQVCQALATWYDEQQQPEPETTSYDVAPLGRPVWILIDADSMSTTLSHLAPWGERVEWCNVRGYANPTTNLESASGADIRRTPSVLPDAADHLLTWDAAQLVQKAQMRTVFLVISRDAALQTPVELLRLANHDALFVPHALHHIKKVIELIENAFGPA